MQVPLISESPHQVHKGNRAMDISIDSHTLLFRAILTFAIFFSMSSNIRTIQCVARGVQKRCCLLVINNFPT